MRPIIHCRCALLALVVACGLGAPAAAAPIGPPDTFEGNAVGSFPAGWSDVALVDPGSPAPVPSAVVVSTTDAFGNPTKALAPVPAIAPSQGVYRAISPSTFYSTSADIRIDRFSDFDPNADPTVCGCPPGAEVDSPMSINFMQSAAPPFHHFPSISIYAGARSEAWGFFVATANVFADFSLGLPVTLGQWYRLQLDVDALAATARSRIADLATGTMLLDTVTSLSAFGPWDPAIDGVFDIESFWELELTARTTASLWALDNINVPSPIPEPSAILLLASALAAFTVATGRIGFRREAE